MQVSVEKTSELARKMTVTVPEEVVQEYMEKRFKSLAREIKLDGFRPGKVPVSLVKKQYAARVRGEVSGDLIQKTYFDALEQQALNPAGQPHIHPAEGAEGLGYIAEFEVYPEISLAGIEQLEITRLNADVTDADIDNMIEKLREQKKDWVAVERPAQQQDRVTIMLSGVCDGENFTNGQIEDFQVEIGTKQMIPGFEDQLVGLQLGEQKVFDLAFPEGYGNEKLAGKTAQFEVETKQIEAPELPQIDAEFIKAYGIADGEVDAFRADIKANMERELGQGLKRKLKQAVMDAIFDNIKITVPNVLIDQEMQELMKPYAENAKKSGQQLKDMDLPRDIFEEQAKRRVSLGLILGEILKQQAITLDDDKVRETVEELASNYERPLDVINWYYSDQKRLQEVQQMVLEDQIVNWVIAQANVAEQSVLFDEVMNNAS